MKIFEEFELPDVFTTNPKEARIQCVHMQRLKKKFLESENQKRPTVGIMLTALFYGWDCSSSAPYSVSDKYNLHVMEYSDHSSYSEILEFVQTVKPKTVKPIITSNQAGGFLKEWTDYHNFRIDMKPLTAYLSKLPQKFYKRPNDLNTFTQEPSSKRPKIALVKPRIYRGPKGAVYDSSEDSISSIGSILISLKDLSDKFEQNVNESNLKEFNKHIDQLNELL